MRMTWRTKSGYHSSKSSCEALPAFVEPANAPPMTNRTGGRILVDQLRIQGCDRTFTVLDSSFPRKRESR